MNQQLKEISDIKGYRHTLPKDIIFILLSIISFGFLYILTEWSFDLWSIIRVNRCEIIRSDYFLITGKDGNKQIVKSMYILQNGVFHKAFIFNLFRFIYIDGNFKLIEFKLEQNHQLHDKSYIKDESTLLNFSAKFGENGTELPEKSLFTILIDELMHPLFVFQLFQIILWIYESYVGYAFILFVVSIISMVETIIQYHQSQQKLSEISKFEQTVKVLRFGQIIDINSKLLVPGDIVIIEPNLIIPCDLALIEGYCIVNEYSINGEQTPVPKQMLIDDDSEFIFDKSSSSILYQTSTCLKCNGQTCLGFVIATGFDTRRGQLIREIKFTPDYSFDFYEDSIRYLKYLSVISIIGYLIALPFKISFLEKYPQIPKLDLVTDVLDLVAVCVPPTLPTTLQIGLNIALRRFRRKEIYCIEPHKINLAGCVSTVCFDKTGTLTEDLLTIYGLIPVQNGQFQGCTQVDALIDNEMLGVIGCCNNLFVSNEKLIGNPLDLALFNSCSAKLSNNTISICSHNYTILQIFDFQSELQRTSVIVQRYDQMFVYTKGSPEKLRDLCLLNTLPQEYNQIYKYYAHHGFQILACGYKEVQQLGNRSESERDLIFLGFIIIQNKLKAISSSVIQQLQIANIKTILVTGDNILTSVRVAKQCNIISNEKLIYGELVENQQKQQQIRWKDFDQQYQLIEEHMNLKAKDLCIDEIIPQSNIILDARSNQFLDLEMKKIDSSVINLEESDYEPLKQNQAIAVTGRVLLYLLRKAHQEQNFELVDQLILKTKVYAKMKREHKAILLKYLKKKSFVSFCGDCGSDILAMRTADVGISLTPLQVSLAAPFTSARHDVSTVPLILLEGRGALTTSFQSFEYMTLCSLVQFISCTILYFKYSYMTNSQFLVIDLFVVLPLSIFMNYTNNSDQLTTQLPEKSLISFEVLGTVIGQTGVQLVFQTIVYMTLQSQSWYVEPVALSGYQYDIEEGFIQSFEATSLFLISNFQYIALSLTIVNDLRFKKPFYTNKLYTGYLIILFIFEIYLMLFTHKNDNNDDQFDLAFKVQESDHNYEMPKSWLLFLCGIVAVNSAVTYIYQFFGLPYLIKRSSFSTVIYNNQKYEINKPSNITKRNKDAFLAKLTYPDGTTQLWDIEKPLQSDCSIEFLNYEHLQGKRIFWHSSAHILGAILSKKYNAQLQFGPSTENGFYYQCILEKEIELDELNEQLKQFLEQNYKFEQFDIPKNEALQIFKTNPYKIQQIQQRNLESYSVYKLHDFIDLCKGPHIDNTSRVNSILINHIQQYTYQDQIAWRFQGVSFPNNKLLQHYLKQEQEKYESDHRNIGKAQKLFMFHKSAPGSAFFLQYGTKIYNKLQEYIRTQYRQRNYMEVITPQMFHKEVWQTSGHLDKYAENIYMTSDNTMGIKPMNCPGHCLLFQMQQHSYRELPIRYADFGVLHRNEVHGALTGLTRVRKFTQDDAHIFCTLEQLQSEILDCLQFLDQVYTKLGFTYEVSLSTRPDKFIGSIDVWDQAENQLSLALKSANLEFKINSKDGAFYGPKIDIMIKDHNDKQHQCGTIQLDFNLPERFNLTYRAPDDESIVNDKHGFKRPVMIHRAILGSLERMIGILTEQYKGKWPFWLSPRQVLVVSVSDSYNDYAKEIWKQLFDKGFETELDISDQTLSKKVRKGENQHFNMILVVGQKEMNSKSVDVRLRGSKDHEQMQMEELVVKLMNLNKI